MLDVIWKRLEGRGKRVDGKCAFLLFFVKLLRLNKRGRNFVKKYSTVPLSSVKGCVQVPLILYRKTVCKSFYNWKFEETNSSISLSVVVDSCLNFNAFSAASTAFCVVVGTIPVYMRFSSCSKTSHFCMIC